MKSQQRDWPEAQRKEGQTMNKVAAAAESLNSAKVALPALGRRIETPKFAIYRKHQDFCMVFNISPMGRIGKQIGYLRLDQQGEWLPKLMNCRTATI